MKYMKFVKLIGLVSFLDNPYADHYIICNFCRLTKIDKPVKSQVPMAKKKVPPNFKIGEARKS